MVAHFQQQNLWTVKQKAHPLPVIDWKYIVANYAVTESNN